MHNLVLSVDNDIADALHRVYAMLIELAAKADNKQQEDNDDSAVNHTNLEGIENET